MLEQLSGEHHNQEDISIPIPITCLIFPQSENQSYGSIPRGCFRSILTSIPRNAELLQHHQLHGSLPLAAILKSYYLFIVDAHSILSNWLRLAAEASTRVVNVLSLHGV